MTETSESGARGRTRRAILSAAARVLARDRSATLADIAAAADVGRSTLHRYYADRDVLVQAVVEDSLAVLQEATEGAGLDQGPPADALRRLVAALVDVGDRALFLWGDPRVLEGYPTAGDPDCEPVDDPMIELIERGQAEGAFDPGVSAQWIQHVVWGLIYTGAEDAAYGRIPRHGVAQLVIRTLENGIRPH
ncbi:TetR/AcrR family transcriptional regulator [Spirillospora sp. NPDC047279]|uniref:TetR/AcrR family transcriptional regulator n=1 Tax=Spirillospora sp. NPDC047279 TaxID=3155478 RepID=UPI0033DF5DF7